MEPRQVEVLHDGRWLTGTLLAARRDAGGPWRGLVHYFDPTVCLGWYHWRPESELRRSEIDQGLTDPSTREAGR
jgi:hypothetical protein